MLRSHCRIYGKRDQPWSRLTYIRQCDPITESPLFQEKELIHTHHITPVIPSEGQCSCALRIPFEQG